MLEEKIKLKLYIQSKNKTLADFRVNLKLTLDNKEKIIGTRRILN